MLVDFYQFLVVLLVGHERPIPRDGHADVGAEESHPSELCDGDKVEEVAEDGASAARNLKQVVFGDDEVVADVELFGDV